MNIKVWEAGYLAPVSLPLGPNPTLFSETGKLAMILHTCLTQDGCKKAISIGFGLDT